MLLFISRCQNLEMITFESIDLTVSLMGLMGKALAVSQSEIKWIAFKSCNLGGDDGVRAIAPFIGKLQLQVLGFESCNLTDTSLSYIASIVKVYLFLLNYLLLFVLFFFLLLFAGARE
jgi:hypothetical protein